jgi:hypothetical protein
MRIAICLITFIAACGTVPNSNLCCSDPADCAAAGLPDGSDCGEGLVCRGNQCIAQLCETSAECDAAAPYCVGDLDGRCQETCDADAQCPGFGQTAAQAFCESGACVECRAAMADCSGETPICAAGVCTACTANDQCGSGVCVDDGTCADESMIAHVATTGSAISDCSLASPCSTIERAIGVLPARPFIVVASGTYSRVGTLSLIGTRRLIGSGSPLPVVKRSDAGPIITVNGGAVISLERIELANATGTTARNSSGGHGVLCLAGGGAPTVKLADSVLRLNQATGLTGVNCTVEARRTRFSENTAQGIELVDSNGTLDGCTIVGNGITGANLDGGLSTVVNSVFARTDGNGLALFSFAAGNRVEFNTFADNTLAGFVCTLPAGTIAPNNILARNGSPTVGGNCTFTSSVIADTNIAAIKFASPDVAPFDYHITAGSIAIDAASTATIDHDIDGQPRPTTGADVGADELQ